MAVGLAAAFIAEAQGGGTLPDSDSGFDWSLWLTAIGTAAAVISALAVIVGVAYWLKKREERAARAAREQQVSGDVADMSDRIERLENVVQAVVTEAEGRRPLPTVRLQSRDGPLQSVQASRAAPRRADVERIIESERRAALNTLPLRPRTAREDNADRIDPALRGLAGLEALRNITRAFDLAGGRYETMTDEDRQSFERAVDNYVAELRAFIPKWVKYLEARREIIPFVAHLDNSGGAPATEASVRLHFPDPCEQGTLPERPKLPTRPEFKRRETALAALARGRLGGDLFNVPAIPTPRFEPPNLTGPFYDDGSVKVRFEYRSIQHHDPFDTDPFFVRIPEPGAFAIGWSVHASNLLRPQEGSLELEVVWDEPDPTPVGTLKQLMAEQE